MITWIFKTAGRYSFPDERRILGCPIWVFPYFRQLVETEFFIKQYIDSGPDKLLDLKNIIINTF